ncbi:MAG TPA: DUF302 domain-containing protein [Promineifilum sp.]|nr:DUF302 domain-containing protein [Promineifilum sp.]HRO24867.1 DUF302 domain-containing protein [Promineifilum sp.]HRO90696.1 DUF302 domain-containing protein [Promineifilum sp.]HRQ14616.1 DUF302 domain-containing protein [Promineifilum sp.]
MELPATVDYGMRIRLALPYEDAIEKVTAALKTEGFGVLTQIDVKATLKQKLDVDFRRYIILGACNPSLAHRAFSTELEIGLLLPCNVVVYEGESGAGSIVSIIDPVMMLGIGINPGLSAVGEEASARLRRVLNVLESL